MAWPCGLMDKASASGAGDCGFESHQGRFVCTFFSSYTIKFFFFSHLFIGVYFECLTHLALSLSLTSRNGSQLDPALGGRESMDRPGATGSSTPDSSSPCTVSNLCIALTLAMLVYSTASVSLVPSLPGLFSVLLLCTRKCATILTLKCWEWDLGMRLASSACIEWRKLLWYTRLA